MTVKDIIELVCDFVGETEIFQKLKAGSELLPVEQEKVDRMVRCFNLVNQEIASDYLPNLHKENIEACGILPFEVLSKKVIHIFELKNRFGLKMKFKVFPNFVEFSGNAKSVTYSFLPDDLTIDDQICSRASARVFAYGVTSEYLLVDGLGDDAQIWEGRFKDALFMLSRKHGTHFLPKRGWM